MAIIRLNLDADHEQLQQAGAQLYTARLAPVQGAGCRQGPLHHGALALYARLGDQP